MSEAIKPREEAQPIIETMLQCEAKSFMSDSRSSEQFAKEISEKIVAQIYPKPPGEKLLKLRRFKHLEANGDKSLGHHFSLNDARLANELVDAAIAEEEAK
ncbi:MAG: hypothetical protein JST01_14425 [Cyanobacteria bacterium SZAS TMP-1]|nr:hypothetical protein [Cyanobacteria bacterium SZAS TMP-1]